LRGRPEVLIKESVMGFFSWLASILPPPEDKSPEEDQSPEEEKSPEEPGWLRRLVIPAGRHDDPKLDEVKRAAAEDVAEMEEENREYFRQDGPGHIEDDL
jgi:hypothetical protein